MEYSVITDIGGTNSRLFLFEMDGKDSMTRKLLLERRYMTSAFKSIYQVLDKFLAEDLCKKHPPTFCTVAIAGAVKNNRITQIANIKWEPINGEAIAGRYGFQACRLLNDFEAVGYSFLTNAFKSALIPINQGDRKQKVFEAGACDRYLIMGFGTGLGVVLVTGAANRETFRVLPSEAGHIGLAPIGLEEWELFQFLRQRLNIPSECLFYQEFLFCGRGLPLVYDFIFERVTGQVSDEPLDARQVFERLITSPYTELRREFLRILCGFLGRAFESMSKLFLSSGGRLVIGGIVARFFAMFFDSDPDLFLQALAPSMYTDPDFGFFFKQKIELVLYTNETEDFAVEGAINHLYLTEFFNKVNKKTKTLSKKSESFRGTPNSRAQELTPKQSTLGSVKKHSVEKLLRPARHFDDFYHSNILKADVLTFTGFLAHGFKEGKLLLGQILSDPVQKFYRLNGTNQEFKGYRMRLLDASLTLICPINNPRLLKNDVVRLEAPDTLYFTKDSGWYFQTFSNRLTDIGLMIFNSICEKHIKEHPLVDLETLPGKSKALYGPLPIMVPDLNLTLETLLITNTKGPIRSRDMVMKVIDIVGPTVFRRNKEVIEEFREVRIQALHYTFTAQIPTWTEPPKIPFVGFFFVEKRFAPGHMLATIFVIDEYSIYDRSPSYDQWLNCDIKQNLTVQSFDVLKQDKKRDSREPLRKDSRDKLKAA